MNRSGSCLPWRLRVPPRSATASVAASPADEFERSRTHPSLHAKIQPDKIAYQMAGSGEAITYGQLEERSNRGAHLFRSLGLKAGDHIALLVENRLAFMEICWAAQRSGLYFTAISLYLTPEEIAYIVNDCGARVVITSGEMCGGRGRPAQQRTRCADLLHYRREAARIWRLEQGACGPAGHADRRSDCGPRHAVFVRYHRATEGCQKVISNRSHRSAKSGC